jgi:hypothetical protein
MINTYIYICHLNPDLRSWTQVANRIWIRGVKHFVERIVINYSGLKRVFTISWSCLTPVGSPLGPSVKLVGIKIPI